MLLLPACRALPAKHAPLWLQQMVRLTIRPARSESSALEASSFHWHDDFLQAAP
jgi:hypothetical protein